MYGGTRLSPQALSGAGEAACVPSPTRRGPTQPGAVALRNPLATRAVIPAVTFTWVLTLAVPFTVEGRRTGAPSMVKVAVRDQTLSASPAI